MLTYVALDPWRYFHARSPSFLVSHCYPVIGDPVPEVDPQKEPPHLLFGQVERVIVKSISPSGMSSVSVEAEGYDERLYQYDNAMP